MITLVVHFLANVICFPCPLNLPFARRISQRAGSATELAVLIHIKTKIRRKTREKSFAIHLTFLLLIEKVVVKQAIDFSG